MEYHRFFKGFRGFSGRFGFKKRFFPQFLYFLEKKCNFYIYLHFFLTGKKAVVILVLVKKGVKAGRRPVPWII